MHATPKPFNVAETSSQLIAFINERTSAIVERFYPDLRPPAFFAGFRISTDATADLIYTLHYLHKFGIKAIGRHEIGDAMLSLLHRINGEQTETFYSYRVAEALMPFGRFSDNTLLRECTPAQRANLATAVDSTHIYNQYGKPLGGRPNNYWGVLARCEFDRQLLGLLESTAMFDESIARVRDVLFDNPAGFFDDSRTLDGRFDVYSFDVQLFLEPLWHLLDAKKLRHNLICHTHLFESIAMENGACVAWGRSIGALSLCMTMEFAAAAIRHGWTSDVPRMLRLLANAFEQFKTWWSDDLINAHRHRMTFGYRGPHRLLQMSLDCLGKLAYAAKTLGDATADATAESDPARLFPNRDERIVLHPEKTAGVWMYRNDHIAFQLPMVSPAEADYIPWLHCPDLFENPVDSQMMCGVPRVIVNDAQFASCGLPASVKKIKDGLVLTFDKFQPIKNAQGKQPVESVAPLTATRHVKYEVAGATVRVEEHWTFPGEIPQAIAIDIPETRRPLSIRCEPIAQPAGIVPSSVAPALPAAFTPSPGTPGEDTGGGYSDTRANKSTESALAPHHSIVATDGMPTWRSFWGELRNLHQISVEPAKEVRIAYEMTPALRVAHGPSVHDYNRVLYDAMHRSEPRAVVEVPFNNGRCPIAQMSVESLVANADILHIGWPEHLFSAGHVGNVEEFDEMYARLVEQIGKSGVKVAWTLHNRRPHNETGWPRPRAEAMYRNWAAITDLAMHHSHCGMERVVNELPFKIGCRHIVLPHAHYGHDLPEVNRAELDSKYKLPPCKVRFGLLGRYQAEKQIELCMQAFSAAAMPEQQLVVTAYRGDTVRPDDPRIIFLPREKWMTRAEIIEHNLLCDALLSAHSGENYLTSGLVGDAIGMGLTMFAPEMPFFREIMGEAAFYHDNSMESLVQLFKSATPESIAEKKRRSVALRPTCDPNTLAHQLLVAFRELPIRLGA